MTQMPNTTPQRTRETLGAEYAIEHAFGVPFADLVGHTNRTGQCSEQDWLDFGEVLFADLVRKIRGEISDIEYELRAPRPGEFRTR